MKLTLDTVSAPVTGERAAQLVRAVRAGKSMVNAKGRAFIASLVSEMRPQAAKSSRRKAR